MPSHPTCPPHRLPRLAVQLKIINADNGYIVNGADFVTVTGVETDFTKQR